MSEKLYQDEDFLRQEYKQKNKTEAEIAEQFDVCPGTIHHWRTKHGIVNKREDEELLRERYLDEEMTIKELASEWGVHEQSIQRALDNFGIDRHTAGFQKKDTNLSDKDWLREHYVEKQIPAGLLAEREGVAKSTVHYWINKYGFENHGKRSLKKRCSFRTDLHGYELAAARYNQVRIHRLVAVAEMGVDAVKDNAVHHKNGIPWDNRPGNLEALPQEEHARLHVEDREWDERGNLT